MPDGGALLPKFMTDFTDYIQEALVGTNELASADLQANIGVVARSSRPLRACWGKRGGFNFSRSFHVGGVGMMDIYMRDRLDQFWGRPSGTLQNMTTQIYAADMNNARILALRQRRP